MNILYQKRLYDDRIAYQIARELRPRTCFSGKTFFLTALKLFRVFICSQQPAKRIFCTKTSCLYDDCIAYHNSSRPRTSPTNLFWQKNNFFFGVESFPVFFIFPQQPVKLIFYTKTSCVMTVVPVTAIAREHIFDIVSRTDAVF